MAIKQLICEGVSVDGEWGREKGARDASVEEGLEGVLWDGFSHVCGEILSRELGGSKSGCICGARRGRIEAGGAGQALARRQPSRLKSLGCPWYHGRASISRPPNFNDACTRDARVNISHTSVTTWLKTE